MQKLHLVGFTADFDGLIFSARKGAKSGSFVVPLDGRLLKQIAEAQQRRDGGSGGPSRVEERLSSPRLVRPESALSPREMQDRIRSGWTLDEVAAEAGVDLDWVRRFAAPVLAEVRRVIERSRAVVYDKPRFGLSALPLGASVRRNVLDRGVRLLDEELDDCWSAYQLDDALWVVRFAYTSRGRSQEAEWLFDLETEELASRNRLAAQLGHVVKGRKRTTVPTSPSVPKPTRPAPPRAAAASRPPKAVPVKPPVAKVPVKKTTAAAKATAKRAAPARPAKRAAGRTPAPKKAPAAPTGGPTTAGRRPSAGSSPARSAGGGASSNGSTAGGDGGPTHAPAPIPVPAPALPPRQQDWPTDPAMPRWEPPDGPVGPLPAPGPAPVPEAVREAAATPFGDDLAPPRPGAPIDPDTGVARIDSRRTSKYVSAPPPRATFRGDVSRAAPEPAPAPRRPRRTEPLRGR